MGTMKLAVLEELAFLLGSKEKADICFAQCEKLSNMSKCTLEYWLDKAKNDLIMGIKSDYLWGNK